MCFSKEMSLGFFLTGVVASCYFKYINKINIFLPILYFSIMELYNILDIWLLKIN